MVVPGLIMALGTLLLLQDYSTRTWCARFQSSLDRPTKTRQNHTPAGRFFPWEPENPELRSKHEPCSGEAVNVKEELDFVASMTFANGGLRKPPCPCCA